MIRTACLRVARVMKKTSRSHQPSKIALRKETIRILRANQLTLGGAAAPKEPAKPKTAITCYLPIAGYSCP
jgi:hypothetical protein